MDYTAYGERIILQGTPDTRFCYVGAFGVQRDASGLLYMRARFYSPYLGRFLNADPIKFSGGLNWFAYCGGDPLAKMDPDGEFFWVAIGATIGAGMDYAAQVATNLHRGDSLGSALTNVNLTSIGVSALAGGLTGGIGGIVSKVGTVGGRAVINAVANGTVSAASQVAKNYLGVNGEQGTQNLLYQVQGAAAFGTITGALGSVVGDLAGNAAQSWAQAQWFKGTELARQLSVQNGVSGLSKGYVTMVDEFANTFFGVTGNVISNTPFNPIADWDPLQLNTPAPAYK